MPHPPRRKEKARNVLDSDEQRRLVAMQSVNSASQSLSALVQSGWRTHSELPPTKKKSLALTSANASAASAAKHLSTLREISPEDLDVERAASSIVGKLITLEMFDKAFIYLSEMHPRLYALCQATPLSSTSSTKLSPSDPLHLLSLPLPTEGSHVDSTILMLTSTYLLHALTVLSQSFFHPAQSNVGAKVTNNLESFSSALYTSPSLLSWTLPLSALPSKHTDSVLTRAYTVLIKFSAMCQTEPRAVFVIRSYAISCLIRTTPGTVDPNTFWDQAAKFGRAFSNLYVASAPPSTEDTVTRIILSTFSDIVTQAEKRVDRELFLSGRGFIGFCEYWMRHCKQASDVRELDRIVALMQRTSASSPTSSSLQCPSHGDVQAAGAALGGDKGKGRQGETREKGDHKENNAMAIECAKLCATFTQVTTLLEQKDRSDDLVRRVCEATTTLTKSICIPILFGREQAGDHLQRIASKGERALEKMRRAAVKMIDGTVSNIGDLDESRECVRALLAAIVDILVASLRVKQTPDLLTQSLDTLFALARAGLNIADPRTYDVAYDHLGHAAAILRVEEDVNSKASGNVSVNMANYIRCVSGAFHNLAGTLYQGGKYGAAVPFLKEGCALGVKALSMHRVGGVSEDGGWKQLREQLYRRWELLGVCYSKIGNRKFAYGAFVECVKAFPFAEAGFVQRTGSGSLHSVYEASAGTKQLGSIVDRVTYLGACELLLECHQVSLRSISMEDKSITGVLLERQLEGLEGSWWKADVQVVVPALLRDALAVYGEDEMPIRRARVLLMCLDFSYHTGPETIVGLGSPDKMGEDVGRLVQRETLGQDIGLAQFRLQYGASAHLWLALHAHRRVDARQNTLVARHVQEACEILKSLIGSMAVNESTPKAYKKSPPKQVAAVKKAAGRAPPTRRVGGARKPHVEPVTPKAKPRKALQVVSLNVVTPPRSTEVKRSSIDFDDFDRFITLLQTTATILGLLGLILQKVQVLDSVGRICERHSGTANDSYIMTSVSLAHEYVKLGKTKRASTIFSRALHIVRNGQTSKDICVTFFLRYAESLANVENIARSSGIYCEALALSANILGEEKGMSTRQRIQTRVHRLEKAAMASHVFAAIQHSREDMSTSLDGVLQSLRLWNRAVDALSRIAPSPTPSKPTEESNPFEMSGLRDALPAESPGTPRLEHPPKAFTRKPSMSGLEWRISEGLLATLFTLSRVYFNRGSAREAEYFAQQAQDMAESLNAPAMISRALARKGEILLHQGQLDEGYEKLMQAEVLLHDMSGTDAADIRRLRGDYSQRTAQHKNAEQLYEQATCILEELDKTFGLADGLLFRPRTSTGSSPTMNATQELVVPELLAAVMCQHIWLLRDDNGDNYTALLNRFLTLPPSKQTKAEENALMGKLTLHNVYGRFRADMFLSSLTESTIALPVGMSSNKRRSLSPTTHDILSTLDNAERLFWADLALVTRRGSVSHVRDAAVSLALIRALQTSLGRAGKEGPALAAGLLDAAMAITLRREILEAIRHKFPTPSTSDDLQWPLITPNGSPLPRPISRTRAQFALDDPLVDPDDDVDGDDNLNENSLKNYWEGIRAKYQSHTIDASTLSSSKTSGLPRNWTVVHITVTEDKRALFVTRQRGGNDPDSEPLVFCVPLKGRRENGVGQEEDEHLTFEDALGELKEIVKLSDNNTKDAVQIKGDDQAARARWWKERGDLDTRMRELLENIEFCWLGAFKTILSERPCLTPDDISELRAQFDRVFRCRLHLQDKTKQKSKAAAGPKTANDQTRITLDDALIECFSTLSPRCKDEELEDLVYFILDLYQFHDVPVALAEVDVVQVVVDLRGVLEEHTLRMRAAQMKYPHQREEQGDEHMFLVLDRNVQGIPWESIPILRGRSVSRVPSVDFLMDRVQFAGRSWQRRQDEMRPCVVEVDRATVDPRKGYYILNPSGDLGRTEGRFKAWLKEMEKVGWEGVIGQAPSEQQFLDALTRKDLVVYFGHGGGEQYVRSHKIRNLPRCAATLLWGCSSGVLREMGDFDPIGTPYNYMLAGCPTLVANIWDVTDKDIDKFSQSVFDKLRMTTNDVGGWTGNAIKQGGGTSLVAAVAQSRDACKLKYLTGAAPVVYGIPFYL